MRGYLLDTHVVSELVRPRPEPNVIHWVAAIPADRAYLSVLALGELRKGIAKLVSGPRRRLLEQWLQNDLRARFAGRILPVDAEVAETWGSLSADAVSRGITLAPVDALLAATALVNDLVMATRNTRHFAHTGVRVFNPWSV